MSEGELFIGNLDSAITEEILFSYFSKYGMIVSMKIMNHLLTHQSRGFGFLSYSNGNSAQNAIKALNGAVLVKNKIKVMPKDKYSNLDPKSNVYISNLDPKTTESDIEKLCSPFGQIFSIKLKNEVLYSLKGEDITCKKANVKFESIEDANNCIKKNRGIEFGGRQIKIGVHSGTNSLLLKGPFTTDTKESLYQIFSNLGNYTINKFDISQEGTSYLAKLNLEEDSIAHSFLNEWLQNRKVDHSF